MKLQNFYKKYYEIRNEIDNLTEILENKHKKEIKCKSGCDLCCIDYSILPVEYYSILHEISESDITLNINSIGKKELECVFLNNSLCSIYPFRPVICRTHGLPLLFANEEGEWELSVCELNFTNYIFSRFTLKNTFPQDKYNSKLFMLNKEFINEFQEVKYSERDLIPVSQLKLE